MKALTLALLLAAGPALAVDRWVAPPAPQVIDGAAIAPVAEVREDSHFIIHLPKPRQEDWSALRYQVSIERRDEQPFRARLETRPFTRTDEVVFVTIPPGSGGLYEIEVIDRSAYPYTRVFKGLVSDIARLGE